jgi:uncharacterized membrane protein
MPDRVVVDQIDFRQALVFPRIVGSVVGALKPARLLVGTFMLVAVMVVGRTYDLVRGPAVQPAGLLAGPRTVVDQAMASEVARRVAREALPVDQRPAGWDAFSGRLDVETVRSAVRTRMSELTGSDREALQRSLDRLEPFRGKGAFAAVASAVGQCMDRLVASVFTLDFRPAAAALGDMLFTVPSALWREDWFSAVFLGVALGLVVGHLGSVISRMAAVDLAGRPTITPVQAFDFVAPRRLNHALVPLWPGVSLLVLLPVALLLGVMGRVPGLDVIAGAAYGLALLFGTLAAVMLVPWVLAMPMAVAASACEGCDGLEAAQRCGALVYRRPLHACLYAACAVLGVCLIAFITDLVATFAIEITAGFAGIAAGQGAIAEAGGARLLAPEAAPPGAVWGGSLPDTLRSVAVSLVSFWQGLLQVFAAGSVTAAIFTAATACYMAMRRTCDGQAFEDLWDPGRPAGVLGTDQRPSPGADAGVTLSPDRP